VLESSIVDLVTIVTLPNLAAFRAKVRPAIPDPITRKSVLFLIVIAKVLKAKYTN
jgi:hypothetical protein